MTRLERPGRCIIGIDNRAGEAPALQLGGSSDRKGGPLPQGRDAALCRGVPFCAVAAVCDRNGLPISGNTYDSLTLSRLVILSRR